MPPSLSHRHRSLALRLGVAALIGTAPSIVLATIVIGDPVRGAARGPGNVVVDSMEAPVAVWQPFRCDGTPGPTMYVHQTIDLVNPDGFSMPAGTWCRVDGLLEGPVVVDVDGDVQVLDLDVVRLRENPPITNFKLVVTGDMGSLVANVDDE